MITLDLIKYIKSQIDKSVPEDLIISHLSSVGWHMEDIEEGITKVKSIIAIPGKDNNTSDKVQEKEEPIEIKNVYDKYHESIEGVTGFPLEEKLPINAPLEVEKKVEIKEEILEEKPEEKINEIIEKIEEKEIEEKLPIEDTPIKAEEKAVVVETPVENIVETPKIWIPKNVEPKIIEQEVVKHLEVEPYLLEVEPKKDIPSVSVTPLKVEEEKSPVVEISNPQNQVAVIDSFSKKAMISSYFQDVISANKEEEIIAPIKKRSFLKWGIVVLSILIISGMVFAFVEGYLKIPGSNFSLFVVKKDSKNIILNAPLNISKLKSYKVETNINISSPSLSNITTGLSSGEVVTSNEKDRASIKIQGATNHVDGKSVFDYILNFKSSILKNDIVSDLKYNGTNLSISVPDLTQFIGENAPSPTIVSVEPSNLGLIINELSPQIQDLIRKIDSNNIISNGIPESISNDVASSFKSFTENLQSVYKGEDDIHGIKTYHYELTSDRQSTKNLLNSLVDIFVTNLSQNQKNKINEVIGSSTINSLELWTGENDDNLYQVKFTLSTPLSRVLGLNDSGIAGNEVELEWITTYYDLNVENNIVMPSNQISMDGFIKNIKDLKIKNIISSFKPQATSFYNSIGSYGKRSNPTGSCTNPNPGSLFSPLGHAKGADGAIGSISSSMNSLLLATNGAGSCYSDSLSWALSVPLSINNNSYYCTDSSGNISTLLIPIKGTICK